MLCSLIFDLNVFRRASKRKVVVAIDPTYASLSCSYRHFVLRLSAAIGKRRFPHWIYCVRTVLHGLWFVTSEVGFFLAFYFLFYFSLLITLQPLKRREFFEVAEFISALYLDRTTFEKWPIDRINKKLFVSESPEYWYLRVFKAAESIFGTYFCSDHFFKVRYQLKMNFIVESEISISKFY